MTDFARESLDDVWEEAQPLLRAHYAEIAHFQDIPLAPDYKGYKAIENAGGLRIFTLRDDGALVGYAVFMVRHNLHYSDSKQAYQDILFLHPAYRGCLDGMRLIRKADARLREEGCQVVYHHMKAAHQFGPLLERMGYELMDLVYAKRLD